MYKRSRPTKKKNRRKIANMSLEELTAFKKQLERHKQQQSKVYRHVCTRLNHINQ